MGDVEEEMQNHARQLRSILKNERGRGEEVLMLALVVGKDFGAKGCFDPLSDRDHGSAGPSIIARRARWAVGAASRYEFCAENSSC